MSKTTITHPDGSTTVISSSGGCGRGCSSIAFVVAVLWVVAAPAVYFPLWLAVIAYSVEAVVAVAAVVNAVARWSRTRGPSARR